MEGWRDMDNGNVELYYAMVNVLDWLTKSNENYYEFKSNMAVMETLNTLGILSEITPQEIGEANDCGADCKTWADVMVRFRELWENGERE
jgi:hypothetical protein